MSLDENIVKIELKLAAGKQSSEEVSMFYTALDHVTSPVYAPNQLHNQKGVI